MNYKTSLPYLLLFFGCANQGGFDSKLLSERANGIDSGIIVSCIRCDCVIDALSENKDLIKKIPLLGDRLCMPKDGPLPVTHLPQNTIDSIFEKNYNLIFYKYKPNLGFQYRLIKTEDALKFKELFNNFFGK